MNKIIVLLSLSAVIVCNHFAQDSASVEPIPLYKLTPQYPENARKLRVEAQIALTASIGSDGNVKKTKLLQAIIFYPGKSISLTSLFDLNQIPASHRNTAAKLIETAQQSAQQWKFKPATVNGKPTGSVIVIPFTFKLASNAQQKDGTQKK